MPRKNHSPFAYEPRPTPEHRVSGLTFLLSGMLVVLVCLMLLAGAQTVHKALANLAHYHVQIGGMH